MNYESQVKNLVKREFDNRPQYHVVVSDLTYVRVGNSRNYICVFVDLFNREIMGYSAGKNKNALLVEKAFAQVTTNLNNIQIFHTYRGNEFKNKLLDDMIKTFQIKRSLSLKGCPYDNAVAEATSKIIKTEFIKHSTFEALEKLQYELAAYVNWFNKHRLHSSLNYLTPVEFRLNTLKKVV